MRDTKRHDPLFDKMTFTLPVHIIGAGGVNSELARALAKLGVGTANEVHYYDGDTVEPHNLPNQAYGEENVGEKKVAALMRNALRWGGVGIYPNIHLHPEFVTQAISLSGIVFLGIDSMRARRDICEQSIWGNANIPILFETRMDASFIIIHALNPQDETHVERWTNTWYPDAKTDNEAGCGGHLAIGTTVALTANLVATLFVKAAAILAGKNGGDGLPNKMMFDLKRMQFTTEYW